MAGKIPWDQNEVALLIEAFISIKDGGRPRNEVIKSLSIELRKSAIERGLNIDEKFRNNTGIGMQLLNVETLFISKKSLRNVSVEFVKMVSLYQNDIQEFNRILMEARKVKEIEQTLRDRFFSWIANRVSADKLSELYFTFAKIEAFCLRTNVLKKPLFETSDLHTISSVKSTVESNRGFRANTSKSNLSKSILAIGYYYKFLKEENDSSDNVMSFEKSSLTKDNANDCQDNVVLSSQTNKTIDADNASGLSQRFNKEESIHFVDFSKGASYAFTRPKYYTFNSIRRDLNISWSQLYIAFLNDLQNSYPFKFDKFVSDMINKDSRFGIADGKHVSMLRSPKMITGNIYIEANLSATNIVGRIKSILDECGINTDRLVICYESINTESKTQEDVGRKVTSEKTIGICDSDYSAFKNWLMKQRLNESVSNVLVDALSRIDNYAVERKLIPARIIEARTYKESKQRILALMKDKEFQKNDERNRKCYSIALNQYLKFISIIPVTFIPTTDEKESTELLVIRGFEEHYKNKAKYVNIKTDLKDLNVSHEAIQNIIKNQKVFFQISFDNYILTTWILERLASVFSRVSELSKTEVLDIIHDVAKAPVMRLNQFHSLFFPNSNKLSRDYLDELKKNYHQNLSNVRNNQLSFIESCSVIAEQPKHIVGDKTSYTQYKDLLLQHFSKGYRINSRIELNRFRRFWHDKYQSELSGNDEEVREKITSLTVRYQDFVYLPELMLCPEKEALIISQIEKCFAEGKPAMYYKALYKEFENIFHGEQINNPDMLKVFLEYRSPGDWYFCNSYVTANTNAQINPTDEVREFLSGYNKVCSNNELYTALSHIPETKIYQVLATNKEFINNARGEYFHINVFTISEEEIDKVSDLIRNEIKSKHYISGNELIEMIENKHPEIVHHNAQFSQVGFRDAIGYYLGDRFSFKGNIISEIGRSISMADVFESFCKSRTSFSIDDLNDLKKELNTVVYFDIVYANALRVSEKEFVSKDRAMFNVERTDIAIDGYCHGDYIPLAEVRHFGTFPSAGFKWNSFLLEHYVAEYSVKYKLLHTSFNSTACVGAIVKRDSKIDDYNDVLARVLAEANTTFRKEEALQLLFERGFIGKRRLTEIEHIISKAKGLR